MLRLPLSLCCVIGSLMGVYSESLIAACRNNDQCPEGFYCQESAKLCYECLRCQDLKREPPVHHSPTACIKSVVECGSCIKGLVADHRGNLDAKCVPPDGLEEGEVMPPYVWVLIVIGLLLLGLIIGIVAYVLKNPDALKVLVSTRTSFQSACYGPREPNAPDAPPPYNPAHYTAVRSESPSTLLPPGYQPQTSNEETSVDMVKRVPTARPAEAREASGTQAARVYNQPTYLRGTEPPPSPVSPAEADNDDFDSHFTLHDENTTESVWTPYGTNNNVHTSDTGCFEVVESGGGEGGAAAGAAAGGEGPSPAKMICTRQDSNIRNRDSNAGSDDSNIGFPRPPSPTHNNPAFVINVVQINNTK